MRVLGTHHVAIATPNVERLREFYAGTLGLPVVGGFPGHGIVFIGAGATAIELVPADPPPGEERATGWQHLALRVDDVDAAWAELTARGVLFHVPPENFPPEDPAVRIAFFRDPDGNEIELIQPLTTGDR